MAGLLSWLLGGPKPDLGSIAPPWGDRPSIYEHIRQQLDAAGRLPEDARQLPDEDEVFEPGALRWVAGGLDGAFGHHAEPTGEGASRVRAALERAARRPTQANVEALYAALKDASTLAYVDDLLEQLPSVPGLDVDRVHTLARWLAVGAADREPVKAAISLLGVMQGYDDTDVLMTLGRHDEFTLYVAVALAGHGPDSEQRLFELAKSVDGWGRIQAVERLAETQDPAIHAWLLREGYKNSVMYEYLAHTCATSGKLHEALAAADIDGPLFDGAGDLLQALLHGAPGPGIDAYEHAAVAVERYLAHAERRAETLAHFLVLVDLERFLSGEERDWQQRQARGWTAERRARLREQVRALLAQPAWRQRVEEGLASDDDQVFHLAASAARALGLDPWERHFARLLAGRDEWWFAMQTDDRARLERVVRLAEERLPLDEIASGPGLELGLGPAFRPHAALDFVLQGLGAFEGLGWPLIRAGMRSPAVRNRNMAIRALAGWERSAWPDEAPTYVAACRDAEPDDDVKERFDKLLAGEPLVD